MVVMDKSSYVNKYMTLLQDTNVYQPCRDLTGQIHRQVQAALCKLKGKHSKEHQWVQLQYNQLLPTGNSSPSQNTAKNTNGFSYNTINCFQQVIPVHQQDFMVYQNSQGKLFHATHSFSLWGIHIQLSQISNQNLKGVRWTYFLICQRL